MVLLGYSLTIGRSIIWWRRIAILYNLSLNCLIWLDRPSILPNLMCSKGTIMSNLEKKMNIRLHSELTENSLNQQLCPLVSLMPLQHFKSLWTISWQTWSTPDKLLYTLMTSWSFPIHWLSITTWFNKSLRSSTNIASSSKSQNVSLPKPPLSTLVTLLKKNRYTWIPRRLLW